MGKSSSSSLKKKRSEISSSQSRIKKRSKSRTKRSSKLKKLRRCDDSLSYSSDSDDSRSSVSVASSTSEDDKRSRRPRSRTLKDVKGSKKRTRRRSSSYGSSEDSRRVKRRKGSGRSGDAQVRKTTLERKKKKTKKKKKKKLSKREVSVSSTSSGSWSCSTCQGGSGSNESEVEKNRGGSERKDKSRRFEKVRSGSRRRRSRSRSCSSCSHYSDYGNEEKLTGDVNFRRLRSVVIVVREGSDGRGMDKDEHKEEMEYDHDDCPPSRSNDSYDGGSKRELVHSLHFASEERNAEDEREEAVVSNIRTGQVIESDKEIEGYDGSNPGCDGFSVKKKNTEDSGAVDSPNAYDLESKLRQKALENLRSFRRGDQTDSKAAVSKKDLIDSNVKTASTAKAELFQNKSPKGDHARVVSMGHEAEGKIIPVESKVSTEFSQNDRNNSDRNDVGKESGAERDVGHPSDQVAVAGSRSERVNVTVHSELNKPRSIVVASWPESSNSCTSKKQIPALQDPQSKSMTGNSVVESEVEDVRTVIPVSGKSNGEEVNKTVGSTSDDPSCPKSISGGTCSNKLDDEAKKDSQFEQKTMTVMRGGEMVEVSYKVYIPKKAPALCRRPLKR